MKYMLIHCIDEERARRPGESCQGMNGGPSLESWLAEMGSRGVLVHGDEAIEVAAKHPTAWHGTIEVRPIAG